jgi:hypothetical protein
MTVRYTLFRGVEGHWWLTVAPGRMYLLKRHDTREWLVYQPGRLVARQPTRGQAISAVLRDLDEGVLL